MALSQIKATGITTASITATHIATDTIAAGDIAANAITASELADDAVDTAAIADDAVTSGKLQDDAVGAAALAANAVVNASIASSAAIDATKIADGSVTSTEFQHISTLSSNAQTQITAKASPTSVNNWTAGQQGEITALTSATTITIDMANSNNFSVTLAHNATFANPSNDTAGQSGSIFITQDGTGSRTASWGTDWDFAGGTAPTLSTTAAAVDRIDYVILNSTNIHAVATLAYS
jgi:hypothetical protein